FFPLLFRHRVQLRLSLLSPFPRRALSIRSLSASLFLNSMAIFVLLSSETSSYQAQMMFSSSSTLGRLLGFPSQHLRIIVATHDGMVSVIGGRSPRQMDMASC